MTQIWSSFRHWIKNVVRKIWKWTKGRRIEYLTLGVIVVYGIIYFSYGTYVDHSYGFGDMYTHHSWIYGLMEGKIFSAGIYPEAMHCFIYAMRQLFGVRIYSSLLLLPAFMWERC